MEAALKTLRLALTFALFASTLVGAEAALANAPKVHGVDLVPWSKKIEEDRYQSPRSWDKTIEYFYKYFRGWKSVRWHREVNLPTIKYVHIENTNEKGAWSGINIYELPNGKVRIYVLKREAPPTTEPVAKQSPNQKNS